MALVIKIQSYLEWKDGLITTEQLLRGETHWTEEHFWKMRGISRGSEITRDPTDVPTSKEEELPEFKSGIARRLFKRFFDPPIDWNKKTHHLHCCCDECAPTREDLYEQVRKFNEAAKREHEESLAPSDSEE